MGNLDNSLKEFYLEGKQRSRAFLEEILRSREDSFFFFFKYLIHVAFLYKDEMNPVERR